MNRFKIVRWLKGGLWYKTEEFGWVDYDYIVPFFEDLSRITIMKTEYHG